MQTTAVINAAINVQKKHPDWTMVPEIMIPLVGKVKKLKYVKGRVVAAEVEFFYFGTNDLTQMIFGFLRDDAGKFRELSLNTKNPRTFPFGSVREFFALEDVFTAG